MRNFLQKNLRPAFYVCWFLLALIQSSATELIADEAYYWVYSKFPAWGYFDHPPMIALVIKGGYSLFHNELGVRLLCAFMSTLTVLITEKLSGRKNPLLFYTIIISIGVFQIAGFMAVPDTPLLFFTALFFLCYRNFVTSNSLINAFWLGLVTALLFYSKYHGLLIVLFTLLSNLKLLRRPQTWLAGFFTLLFFSPHLFWQWQHNWISFRYHLFESNVSGYRFSYTTDYLLGQILLAGPLAGFLLLPAAFLYKTKNETERALKFTMVGIYIFFLVSSLRGKVEANWPMPALIALVILSYGFINEKTAWIKPLRIISVISFVLIMAGRLYLIADIGPDNPVKKRFHGNRDWAAAIVKKTGNTPVVFYSSYQRPSLFWFYSGSSSHSVNLPGQRKNNYNFWPTKDSLLGKPVFVADVYDISNFPDSVNTKKGWVGLRFTPAFTGE